MHIFRPNRLLCIKTELHCITIKLVISLERTSMVPNEHQRPLNMPLVTPQGMLLKLNFQIQNYTLTLLYRKIPIKQIQLKVSETFLQRKRLTTPSIKTACSRFCAEQVNFIRNLLSQWLSQFDILNYSWSQVGERESNLWTGEVPLLEILYLKIFWPITVCRFCFLMNANTSNEVSAIDSSCGTFQDPIIKFWILDRKY